MKRSRKVGGNRNGGLAAKKWPRYILSLVLGLISSAAYDYIRVGRCDFSTLFFVRTGLLFGLYLALFCSMRFLLIRKDGLNNYFDNKITDFLFGDNTSMLKQTIVIAGIIFAMWLPYFVVSYPGNMSNDTTGQIPMFFSMFDDQKEYAMQDQHPVFTTVIFGGIVYLGNLLFNNMHRALALCILLQMVVTALVFGFVIVWARRKWKVTIWLSLCVIGLLTICPVVPLMVISLSKDTFFSWIYVLFIVALFEMVRQDFKILKNWKYVLTLTLACLGVCLTKKLGVYIVSGTLLLFIMLCGQQWKIRLTITIPLIVSGIVMFIILPFIIRSTGIYPSPTKEMLALPFQQTALTYIRHKDEMSNDELAQLDKVLDLSTLEQRYIPANGDLVKGPVDNNSDFGAYVKLYVKQFFVFPDSYFDAFAVQVAGLFLPYRIDPIFDSSWHTWNGDYFEENFFEKPEFSDIQSKELEKFYEWFSDVPVIEVTTFTVTYVVIVPFLFLICVIENKKRKREVLLFVPILISMAGLMVGSIVYHGNEAMRYIMPFVYTAPVLLVYAQYLLFI